MTIASIQVQTTRQKMTGKTSVNVGLVSQNDEFATHWSLYTRDVNGLASWVKDFSIKACGWGPAARNAAMTDAAFLSMKHQVPIEQIK